MLNDPGEQNEDANDKSFADILNEFESATRAAQSDTRRSPAKGKGRGKTPPRPALQGSVVGVSDDYVLVDYGAKSEGVIPCTDLRDAGGQLTVKVGDRFNVAITGFNKEGLATLSRVVGPRPRDWDGLNHAFQNKDVVA